MDAERFDQLTRAMGRPVSRRSALKVLLAAVAGGALGLDGVSSTARAWDPLNGLRTTFGLKEEHGFPGGPWGDANQGQNRSPEPTGGSHARVGGSGQVGKSCPPCQACETCDTEFGVCVSACSGCSTCVNNTCVPCQAPDSCCYTSRSTGVGICLNPRACPGVTPTCCNGNCAMRGGWATW